MTVGEKIKIQRELIGMSQEELAKKMGYKDRSSISKIEKGSDMNLPMVTVQKFAEVLNCSPLLLMGWDGNENNTESENDPVNEHEKEFIRLYSQLPEEQQILIDNLMKSFLSK